MFASKKLGTIESVVNCELKCVSTWLSLNAGKTELIFFHSKQHKLNYDNISIKFNGVKLSPVDYVKYLGMYIDKYLSWNFHILQLNKKLSRANGILSKLRHNAPFETCLQVYYAIFYSHLVYGCNIWGLTSEVNLKKVEVLQRKCIRILTFSDFRSPTNHLFLKHKILKVRDVIKFYQLKLVYEYFENALPIDLMSLFKKSIEVHNYQLRRRLHIPSISTSMYGNLSIKYSCPVLWNKIFEKGVVVDKIVRNNVKDEQIHIIHQLKRILKKHFLFTYSLDES